MTKPTPQEFMDENEIITKAKIVAMNLVTSEYGALSPEQAYDLLTMEDVDALQDAGWDVWDTFERYSPDEVASIVEDVVDDIHHQFHIIPTEELKGQY